MESIGKLKNLSSLNLAGMIHLSDEGLKRLAVLSKLEYLNVIKTNVTEAGVEALSKALPDCRIEWDGGVIEPTNAKDRALAKWVVEDSGGRIWIRLANGEERAVAVPSEIPDDPFQVTELFTRPATTDLDDLDVSRFEGCAALRSVNFNFLRFDDSLIPALKASERSLTQLHISNTAVTKAGLQQALELFPDLQQLSLRSLGVTDDELKLLANFTKLTRLQLQGNESLTEAGVTALSKTLPNCRIEWDGGVIGPTATLFDPEDMHSVARWVFAFEPGCAVHVRHRGKVTVFTDESQIPEDDFSIGGIAFSFARDSREITKSELAQLVKLDWLVGLQLGNTNLTDSDLRLLQAIPNLEALDVSSPHLTDDCLDELLPLTKLHQLFLFHAKITDKGMEQIVSQWPAMKSLSLSYSQVTDSGVAHLSKLKQLRRLKLNSPKITDDALVVVGECSELDELDLSGNGITDAGVAYLAKLENLDKLRLNETKVSDVGLEYLRESQRLELLEILGTQATVDGVARLKLALPDCEIMSDFTDEEIDAAMKKLKRD